MLCLFCRLLCVSGCSLTWMAAGVMVTEDPKDGAGEGAPGVSGWLGAGLIWEGEWEGGRGRGSRSDCFYLRFKFRTCVSC